MTVGIYALYWEEQDLIYIGQSQHIEQRFKEHLRNLEITNHSNYKVQEAYNKYGIPKTIILERCDIPRLNLLEITWQKEFDSLNSLDIVEAGSVGFGPYSNSSKYSKIKVLRVFSLLYRTTLKQKEISKRENVNISLVRDISSGNGHLWLSTIYPKNYTCMQEMRKLRTLNACKSGFIFYFRSIEGIEHKTDNLRKFAKEFDLDASKLSRLTMGKSYTHKGWIFVRKEETKQDR